MNVNRKVAILLYFRGKQSRCITSHNSFVTRVFGHGCHFFFFSNTRGGGVGKRSVFGFDKR